MAIENWRVVTRDLELAKDPAAVALYNEALAATPSRFVASEDVVGLLPRMPGMGRCRICGTHAPLTREHIPPKATGNVQRHKAHAFSDYLAAEELGELPGGRLQQGGVFGFTLCADCNSLTGRLYGEEYKRWALLGEQTLRALPHPEQLDQAGRAVGWNVAFGKEPDAKVSVGAMVRQVLSFMCTLSGSWDLAETHPALRRTILEQDTTPLPAALELGICLYHGPQVRLVGPTLQVTPDEGAWRWLMEMAYPPFAFLLVVASNIDNAGLGLMMADWVQYGPKTTMTFEGVMRIGFGWTPYPGDYRSRSEIAAEGGGQPPADLSL